MNYLEKQLVKLLIWRLKKGFGADCPDVDWEKNNPFLKELNHPTRCPSCAAREIIDWLKYHYEI